MLKRWIKNIITEVLTERNLEHTVEVIKLDTASQYMVVVPDDTIAQDLANTMREVNPDVRMVIVASSDITVTEFKRKQ